MLSTTELNQLMKQLANDAETFLNAQYKISLDNSIENDIPKIESVIDELKAERSESFSDKEVFTLSNVLGAYVGMLIQKKIGGEWLYDTTDESAPAVRLIIGTNDYPFASLIYQQLTGTPDISMGVYVQHVLSQHSNKN